ncbi:Aldehyde/histidinol dehydrogenase [Dichomitus squalens]|uniref:aldehyde dehydrogenase (NAD(+)) n=1 Tax=Dichomitus squalens TaxID=114155 RepID=A0A4Q9M525_9APHY|nr:Aldehyde/histidinol dehydrogenase [Dichomitus squalens]
MRGAVAGLVLGWRAVGGYVDGSFDVDVVSSTCSEAVGRGMSKTVQGCFGKVLLELGGNNAAVVMPSADLNIVLPARPREPAIAILHRVNAEDRVWSMDSSAPVLTVGVFDEREQPIEWSNSLSQGLSSDLWTGDVRNVEKWAGPAGSDAEIVIVNVSTSGEEIGAAFGG